MRKVPKGQWRLWCFVCFEGVRMLAGGQERDWISWMRILEVKRLEKQSPKNESVRNERIVLCLILDVKLDCSSQHFRCSNCLMK